jgi:hypothetical protein
MRMGTRAHWHTQSESDFITVAESCTWTFRALLGAPPKSLEQAQASPCRNPSNLRRYPSSLLHASSFLAPCSMHCPSLLPAQCTALPCSLLNALPFLAPCSIYCPSLLRAQCTALPCSLLNALPFFAPCSMQCCSYDAVPQNLKVQVVTCLMWCGSSVRACEM